MKRRILVSGASGLIGSALLRAFRSSDYDVVSLTRGQGEGRIVWDPAQELSPNLVSGFDAVVHLAGESIVGRWTAAKKRQILESRVQGTRRLAEALARASSRPRVLVAASAVGYYGNRGDEVLREESASGSGFLAEVCRQWEEAAQAAAQAGIRTVHTRFGLVLSPEGGALPKMLLPFRLGLGGRVGDGRQWWSWIHIADVAGAILHTLNAEVRGPVNVVGPNPATNAEFTKALGAALSRPTIFPMPAFAARLAFGEMGDELLLASQRVQPAKLVASGFEFRFTDLGATLREICRRH
ncbi:MAG TPA: TIGR01777 family oxidoreductase [Terriglobales bacterium]|nr:TIGR01777 family oxidoreductase [Terriglobales bacterium]